MSKKKMKTKKVFVMMGALVRREWSHVVEVPADMSNDEVVEKLSADLDGSEYEDDPEFWEDGLCYAEEAKSGDKATRRLTADGELEEIE